MTRTIIIPIKKSTSIKLRNFSNKIIEWVMIILASVFAILVAIVIGLCAASVIIIQMLNISTTSTESTVICILCVIISNILLFVVANNLFYIVKFDCLSDDETIEKKPLIKM
jgi:hypothetical protein